MQMRLAAALRILRKHGDRVPLKNALVQLRAKDPSKEEWIAQIAIQTEGFTVVSKIDCEAILTKVSEMLGGDNA